MDMSKPLVALLLASIAASANSTAPSEGSSAPEWVRRCVAQDARTFGTDYTCVSNCTSQGYQYQFCVDKCSFPDNPPPTSNQVDYKCVSDCTSQGYQYSYCLARCSY